MSRAYGMPLAIALAGVRDPEMLYRVEAVRYSYIVDADRDEYGVTDPKLEVFRFKVLKWTEHGATLANQWSGSRRRWVDLRVGTKQWASRTIEEAVRQLVARRSAQIYILKRQMARAEQERNLAISACNALFEGLGLISSATEIPQ